MNCKEINCPNDVKPNSRSPYCAKCRSRRFRLKHRVKALFFINKSNAVRRGISWEFTMDEWIIFCAETNYHNLVGQGPKDMTIDRVDNSLGYSYSNCQLLTLEENGRKGKIERRNGLKNWKCVLKGDPNIPF